MSIPKRDQSAAQAKMSKSLFGGAGAGFGLPAQAAKMGSPSAEPMVSPPIPPETSNVKGEPSPRVEKAEDSSLEATQYHHANRPSEGLTQALGSEVAAAVPALSSSMETLKTAQGMYDNESSKGPVPRIQRSQIQRTGADRGLNSRYKRPITLRLPADVADMLESKIDVLEARSLNQLLVVLLQSAADSPEGLAPFVKSGPVMVTPGASIKDRARALLAAQGGRRPDDIQQISLRLPSDLGAKINRAAKSAGKKLSPFLIEAISSLAQTI